MSSPKFKSLAYTDVVRLLNDKDIQSDLIAACSRLGQSMTTIVDRFDDLSPLLQTIDLQGLSPPMKPHWSALRKSYKELVWQLSINVGSVAARLKLFSTNVLLCLSTSRPSDQNNLVVLRSYSQISSDFAAMSRTLAENFTRFNSTLTTFSLEFFKLASKTAKSGQRELQNVSHRISELESHSRQFLLATTKLASPEVSHLAYSTLRMITHSGRRGKTRLSYNTIMLSGPEVQNIYVLEQQLDRTRNEVAHAEYTAQLSQSATDSISNGFKILSKLISDEILAVDLLISLLLAVWARLQTDCSDVFRWLSQRSPSDVPHVISSYGESGSSLYGSIANALESYVSSIDPHRFQKEPF